LLEQFQHRFAIALARGRKAEYEKYSGESDVAAKKFNGSKRAKQECHSGPSG
jgi:hypothetical protein